MVPDYRRGDPGEPPNGPIGGRSCAKRPGPILVDRARDASTNRPEPLYEMTNGFVPLIVSAVNGVLVQLPVFRP